MTDSGQRTEVKCQSEERTVEKLEEKELTVPPALLTEDCMAQAQLHTNHTCHNRETNNQTLHEAIQHKDSNTDRDIGVENDMSQDTTHKQSKVIDSDSESSSSESDQEALSGYVLLPQDPDNHNDDDFDVEEKDDGDGTEIKSHWHEIEQSTGMPSSMNIESAVCEGGEDESNSVEPVSKMEDNEVNAIKQAMAGFSLPNSSMPDWAKVVPEEVWKSKLIKGLQKSQSKRTQ